MRFANLSLVLAAISMSVLAGCATSRPPSNAAPKVVSAGAEKITLAGVYKFNDNEVIITATAKR